MFLRLLSYPRSILAAIVYPFILVAYSSLALLMNLLFNSRHLDDTIIMSWAQLTCHLFGVDVEVEGYENIPKGGCVFLFNHGSFFDIFAMAGWIRGFRFGAKIELFSIPVFGRAMTRVGILPIARDRKEEVFRVYKAAQVRIAAGERFALAPEGTRQSVERLGPFKAGPFIFAINARAPVVPVIIRNAVSILPKDKFIPNMGTWKTVIKISILPQISTEGLEVDDRPQLQEQVRAVMQPYFPV